MSLVENQNEISSENKKIKPVVLNVSKKILSRESIFRNIADAQLDLDNLKKKSNSKLTE